MNKEKILQYLPWALAIFVAFVFVQSLFFKFSNSFETQHIFGTIGSWLGDIGLPEFLASGFADYGGYVIGTIELIAALLILRSATQSIGAALGFCVISGAIFFHLFTPLGVSVIINEAGDQDGGQLFAMAVAVWVATALIVWMRRKQSGKAG